MSELKIAGPGEIYVCGACGKTFINPYEVDVSCMLNRVLCREDSLEYDKNGRVIKADPVEIKEVKNEIRKINSKYLQCKEAYIDGFREGFSRAYHLGDKGEYHEGYKDGFKDAFHISLGIDKAFTKDGGKE